MRTMIARALWFALILCAPLGAAQQGAAAQDDVLRGWLSDEACARGRASGGVYTGTNPDCAKRCVAQGKKIVLIVPDEEAIFDIANQEAAKKNIGDYVEVTGLLNRPAKSVHIDSLKMLEQGRAMCDVPPRRK